MFVVCIDPGHGGADPGAVGHGLLEKNIALAIGLKVAKRLEGEPDVSPVLTYRKPLEQWKELGLADRCYISDQAQADCFVSIHCNAAANANAYGSETFYCPGSVNGAALARAIQSELNRTCPEIPERRVEPARFYVLTQTSAPAALVETGFLSNAEDARLLGLDEYQERCAAAIVAGILRWLRG
jgi:N-acetylmuramoyl-L-alanine amidase